MFGSPEEAATFAALASAVATSLAVIITGVAAWATWYSPQRAAEYAEKLRSEKEYRDERSRLRKYVFFTLMQERAAPYSNEAVKALNSVDIIFYDVRAVREAWANYFASLDGKNNVPQHAQKERFISLLKEISKEVGIHTDLRLEDFSRIYYPEAIAKDEMIRQIQREMALEQLANPAGRASNVAPSSTV